MDHKFIQIDGTKYAVPASMTDTQMGTLGALLLTLRRIDAVYCSEYKQHFNYVEQDSAVIRTGISRDVHNSHESAKQARDEYNKLLSAVIPA